MKTSEKLNAQYVGRLLKEHGCTRVVISPGSRNAPLIIALTGDAGFRCISVPDERVAAFTAMGMCLAESSPVAVICTSGSASVNFYPAVAEAYYQHLPLVVITADRPEELVDQGVGQTIRQKNLFAPHVEASVHLLRDPHDELARHYNQRLLNEALLCTKRGPVHINIPFDEPLYGRVEVDQHMAKHVRLVSSRKIPDVSGLEDIWKSAEKVMLLAGYMSPSERINEILDAADEQRPFLLFSETVSNIYTRHNINHIDRIINTIDEGQKEKLQPDLLITMGGELVSKMVKQFLKEYPPKHHWHISPRGELLDTFQSLSQVVHAEPEDFLEALTKLGHTSGNSDYRQHWLDVASTKLRLHQNFARSAEYSDWLGFERITRQLPENSILHTANSASIRYSQLFDHKPGVRHYTNRGTSGIDGCTSTAIGHAMCTELPVFLVTGDVAFLYDSNAFWNDQLPGNLKVIIINNSGGNIFRIIKGPEQDEVFENFQETSHNLNLSAVADIFSLKFQSVSTLEELDEKLPEFMVRKSAKPEILEIRTPRKYNPEVLANYFEYLRQE